MGAKKHINPLITWSVLAIASLATVGCSFLFYLTQKAEVARNQVLVQNYRTLGSVYDSAAIVTSLGRVELRFVVEDAPVTTRNFMRIADAGVFNNTVLKANKETGFLETGVSAQEISADLIKDLLGKGRKISESGEPLPLTRGAIGMRITSDVERPDLFFVLNDVIEEEGPRGFTVFGYVTRGMEFLDAAYARDASPDVEDLPVIVRTIELKGN